MLLKSLHFRFEDVGFEERNCGILQDVSCASIQVAASPRERLDKILEKCWLNVELGNYLRSNNPTDTESGKTEDLGEAIDDHDRILKKLNNSRNKKPTSSTSKISQ